MVKEAFQDAIEEENGIDYYARGWAESNYSATFLGSRISGNEVSQFCGRLAANQFFHVPDAYRDGVWFNPSKPIPIPVLNVTFHIPTRWFRNIAERSPLIYICYEGDSFLKLLPFETKPTDWTEDGRYHRTVLFNSYNDRCRIREVMIKLDDHWNNRYLLPRKLSGLVTVYSDSILPRMVFDKECDMDKGTNQQCCLWKFFFNDSDGTTKVFHRCFGSIPMEALKNAQVPDALSDVLISGGFTRRFLNAPTRVCRGIEFRPFVMKQPDGKIKKLEKVDAIKCAAFY
ncbi:hypothetical protein CRE_26646 [Caenorhabditis remanei]|uniref:Uncharacterized protein n=1 Tax=Caenorhabditis remanei TaxID=31234 RepID=E3ML17_CAERE|nr:hypothetical protein CRE_26646 [Caenorhabditis remanei]